MRPMWTSAGSRRLADWMPKQTPHAGLEWRVGGAPAGYVAALVDALYGVPREYSPEDALSIELP